MGERYGGEVTGEGMAGILLNYCGVCVGGPVRSYKTGVKELDSARGSGSGKIEIARQMEKAEDTAPVAFHKCSGTWAERAR